MPLFRTDKCKIKEIFDCIRNYIICGAVFYAGILSITKSSNIVFFSYLNIIIGILFIVGSIYLLIINTIYLNKDVLSLSDLKGIKFHLANIIASIFALLGFTLMTQSAMEIKTQNNTRLNHKVFSEATMTKNIKESPNKWVKGDAQKDARTLP